MPGKSQQCISTHVSLIAFSAASAFSRASREHVAKNGTFGVVLISVRTTQGPRLLPGSNFSFVTVDQRRERRDFGRRFDGAKNGAADE